MYFKFILYSKINDIYKTTLHKQQKRLTPHGVGGRVRLGFDNDFAGS